VLVGVAGEVSVMVIVETEAEAWCMERRRATSAAGRMGRCMVGVYTFGGVLSV
jgi:hypothetical protein